MKQPVVIIAPTSSGADLASTLRAQGVPVVGVVFERSDRPGYGNRIQSEDFVQIIPIQNGLESILRELNPLAIVPGADDGVPLADSLCRKLTPQFANDEATLTNRIHKFHMQDALRRAGLPYIRSLCSRSEGEVEAWIREQGLEGSPLILKPPSSAGSDKVFHVRSGGGWRAPLRSILSEPSRVTGLPSDSAVVQEMVMGTEFAVGTISEKGRHHLAHLIRYTKRSAAGRDTLFDHVEFLPFHEKEHGELLEYTRKALDALGIRWGGAHTEVMLTAAGPRLIETGARMCGGPVVRFAREATGSSQADKWSEIFSRGEVVTTTYQFKKTVVPVFLKSPHVGTVSNAEVFDEIERLPTFFRKDLWFRNGTQVPQTVDYLSSIGIVALAGERAQVFQDLKRIRDMEAQLTVVPSLT